MGDFQVGSLPDDTSADPGGQAAFVPTVSWLKLTLETMRSDDPSGRPASLAAEQGLVDWLVARDLGERQTEAMR